MVLTGAVFLYDVYGLGVKPIAAPDNILHRQTGLASWYGKEQQDKLTANGERFDRNKLTATNRILPFNSKVRVTNPQNGRTVQVRINDHGPYVKNRELDLSEAAAKALDMKKTGVSPVHMEVQPRRQLPPAAPGSTLP